MPDIQLSFAKIVATPTATAWSQAYNAGSLFGVLSLKTDTEDSENTLNTLGKDVFTNLQTEFYSLEDKSLALIKTAIEKSYSHVPETISISFCVAFVKQDILYLLLTGNGKVAIKRSGQVGILLDKTGVLGREITTASGYLQNGDIIVLQTQQFAAMVTQEQLQNALDSTIPNEIAETLTPQIHQTPEGGASALILNFIGAPKIEPTINPAESFPADTAPITPIPPSPPPISPSVPSEQSDSLQMPEPAQKVKESRLPFHFSLPPFLTTLPKKQLTIIGVIILIVIILFVSILSVKRQQAAKQTSSLFQNVYTQAQDKFKEGQELSDLNKPLAHDDYQAAENFIKSNLPKFPKDSQEYKKLSDLLAQVDSELAKTEGSVSTPVKEVDLSTSPLLQQIQGTPDAIAGVSADNGISILTPKAILVGGKELIQNNNDWTDAKAIGTFLGNYYVLDTKNGILKFSNAGSSFPKSSYFSSSAPDLSNASGMAIDGSIWVLYSTGTIEKYTKGVKDTFSIKGLTNALSKPTSIVTTSDSDNLYVLDPGSTRLVVLKKDGTFQTQYKADVIKDAKAMDINEKDKKAYILSNGKTYELDL